jgi:hypothetical protein
VSGSRILTEGTKSVPFPGPIRRNGAPDPELLKAFIRQSQLTSQQSAMDAKDWNNLGYAYANLPTPQLPGAQDAFARARALTRDTQLLGIINANLTRVTEALRKLTWLRDIVTAVQPREVPLPLPLPDVTHLRKNQPLGSTRAAPPRKSAAGGRTSTKKTSATRGGKKPGSKGSRR